ncbi:uncharacterized protein ARB_04401 [Trichophyton benhamiae CBS 112371]|uniref:Uncharacterized protein n=1 Tax=Arthroderma benhamiae (strain ATCC MYA-4681 / CBS 112371) TaxID=663331 RepID=D4AJF1_ARTBC|nr:uncharacterized protein ARB_04401 [Trichophyton benhamiae CBS 112371]EFE36874.1 hypothetical protein ARB_04401 [Trichophyton benhamiae CBS 112371]
MLQSIVFALPPSSPPAQPRTLQRNSPLAAPSVSPAGHRPEVWPFFVSSFASFSSFSSSSSSSSYSPSSSSSSAVGGSSKKAGGSSQSNDIVTFSSLTHTPRTRNRKPRNASQPKSKEAPEERPTRAKKRRERANRVDP